MGRVRARVLREVRNMPFEDVLGRFADGRLDCARAADALGVSLSTFGRWRRRYEEEGLAGLADRRLGRASARRAPAGEVGNLDIAITPQLTPTLSAPRGGEGVCDDV
jgi:hypothetical protein